MDERPSSSSSSLSHDRFPPRGAAALDRPAALLRFLVGVGQRVPSSGFTGMYACMPQNFMACDREQELLLPPNLRDWLPEDHFCVVRPGDGGGDRSIRVLRVLRRRRPWACGARAGDDARAVALRLCEGQRSSRGIERECLEDVAYRVIAANQRPDHPRSRAFAGATRTPWPPCSVGALVVRRGGTGGRQRDRGRRHEGARTPTPLNSPTATSSRSPGRSSPRPPRQTGSRMSSSARPAATSCRRSFRLSRVVAAGCATLGGALRQSETQIPSLWRARAQRG